MKIRKNQRIESSRERKVSFASLIVAFSLLGFLWPHYGNTGNRRHRIAFQTQTQRAVPDWDHDEDGFYTPTRSPGWNDLNH
jgi:hypothetical protein